MKMDQVPMIPRRVTCEGQLAGPVAFVERLTIFPAKLTHSASTGIHAVALGFLLGKGQFTAPEGRTGPNHALTPSSKRRAASSRHRHSCQQKASVSLFRCLFVSPKRIDQARRIGSAG